MLTERLIKFMHKLVDTQQFTFIKGKQIVEVMLMANAFVDSRVGSNAPAS